MKCGTYVYSGGSLLLEESESFQWNKLHLADSRWSSSYSGES